VKGETKNKRQRKSTVVKRWHHGSRTLLPVKFPAAIEGGGFAH